MWKHREGIRIEGPSLTCKDVEETERYGARYLKPFCKVFPHFEVSSNIPERGIMYGLSSKREHKTREDTLTF